MKLFFRETGEGPPLVILHGLYGSSDNWMNVAGSLSGHFRVCVLDLRNHGRSPHSDKHTYEAMMDDLTEFFNDNNIGKATILGHSMGGKLAVCFAGHYPELVQQLIVVDIAPVSYNRTEKQKEGKAFHASALNAMKSINPDSLSSRPEADKLLSKTVRNKRIRQFLLKNLTRKEDKSFSWKLNLDVLIREQDNIMDGINDNCPGFPLPATGFPVLFIRGEKSLYVSDEDIPAIRKIFPQAEISTIQGAGHWLHAEKSVEFVREVLRFTFS